MVKSLIIGLLAVPLVLAVALVPVEARPHRGSLDRLQAELSLTDTQVQAIRQIHQDQRDARIQLRRSLREARRTLREMVIDGVEEVTVQQKTAEVQQLVGQAVQLRTDTLRAMAQLLTPEQRAKLREMRPHWH
jgi:Spy/CpxP family protein refolding chaperone